MTDASEQAVAMFTIVEPADRDAGWVVVASPADALRRVRASRPRAVLVQVDTEAVERCLAVLEELHRRWPHLPLVVVSSRHDDQVERRVRAAGAHCYLHGAVDPAALAQLAAPERGVRSSRAAPPGRRPLEPRATGPPRRHADTPQPGRFNPL